MNRKRGFTLIELLVVIVIIAILAAILFPVFARAKEKARQTSCMSNMKSLGLALAGYTADHGGKYPMCYRYGPRPVIPAATCYASGPATALTGCSPWPILLQSYVGGKAILKCRTDGSSMPSPPAPRAGIPTEYSYGYNKHLGGVHYLVGTETWGATSDSPTREWTPGWSGGGWGVHFPSKTVAFYETKGWSTSYGSTTVLTDGEAYQIPQPITDTTKAHSRHNGAANYTFCDGHAEYMKPDKIKGSSTNGPEGTVGTRSPGPIAPGWDLWRAWNDNWCPDAIEDIPGPDAPGTNPTFSILF